MSHLPSLPSGSRSIPTFATKEGSSRKRVRIQSTQGGRSHSQIEVASDQAPERSTPGSRPRLRAAVACTTCRLRKTKCDGGRPTCGYCERTQSRCQYDGHESRMPQPSSITCNNIGHEVLQALQDLKQIIQRQQVGNQANADNALSPAQSCSHHGDDGNQLFAPDKAESDILKGPTYRLTASEGLDSILKWKVFPDSLSVIPVDSGEPIQLSDTLPSTASSYLKGLVDNYIVIVHIKNPMLDLNTLHNHVVHVAENGFDWSTRACLVALVCAIGALCRDPGYGTGQMEIVEAAKSFWSVAAKRLGLAMTHNTVESAQCLCLSGIFFMCFLQPLEAWKHFTMAGNAWYSAMFARSSRSSLDVQLDRSILQSLEQSIFYTSYKSELEIRYELGMHGSVLEDIEDRIVFPIPPNSLDAIVTELSPDEGAISWYFYLSDIAARHLINRIVESRSQVSVTHNAGRVRALIHEYETFLSQLNIWYESLAPEVSFELPKATILPDPNLATQILRARYLFIHELLCRPFLKICLNEFVKLPDELFDKVVALASLGLKHCAWKLQSLHKPTRYDHGLWIAVRNTTACSMMLIGAMRGKQNPLLNAAKRLEVPEDWREMIVDALVKFEFIAHEKKGGVANCVQLVHDSLTVVT